MYFVIDRTDKKRVAIHRFDSKQELEVFANQEAIEQYAGKRTFSNADGDVLAAGNYVVIEGKEIHLSVTEVRQPKFQVDISE